MPLTLAPAVPATAPDVPERVAAQVEAEGYCVIADVLTADQAGALVAEVERVEAEHDIAVGANEFEGFHTRRIFNLIAAGEPFRDVVLEPTVLAAVEAILGVDFLLSGTTSMHISPSETPQLLHADDGMVSLPRPHPATMVTTLWALSDFRAENGATHVVPGSHRFPDMPKPGDRHDVAHAEMSAGSVLVLHGSTWHGGGANDTDGSDPSDERYGLSIQFVAGWCRQQQNLMLGTPIDVVATYPPRLQELIGYSMFRNVMGHVNREHPRALLGLDGTPDMVWDKMQR
ncbi:MAG: phytanoyl-CoA dioxygenase [Acidimicrobiales bacterium]|nr:phytanoyl-CoA dioxygenase [Acidimicrobiales bacterium]